MLNHTCIISSSNVCEILIENIGHVDIHLYMYKNENNNKQLLSHGYNTMPFIY